jgi:hypothetical protein
MSTAAILTMIVIQVSFTLVTAYFFLKVLRSSGKKDPDPVPDDTT